MLLLQALIFRILHFVEDAVENLHPLVNLFQGPIDLRLKLSPVPHRGLVLLSHAFTHLTTTEPSDVRTRACFCSNREASGERDLSDLAC